MAHIEKLGLDGGTSVVMEVRGAGIRLRLLGHPVGALSVLLDLTQADADALADALLSAAVAAGRGL